MEGQISILRTEQICRACGLLLPISFYEYRKVAGVYRRKCKSCVKQVTIRRTLWRKENDPLYEQRKAEKNKNSNLRSKQRRREFKRVCMSDGFVFPIEKRCSCCGLMKQELMFSRDCTRRDGLSNKCKSCAYLKHNQWRKNNKSHCIAYARNRWISNKSRLIREHKTTMENILQKMPWYTRYTAMKARCSDKNHKSYHRYGGRGIKCLMTIDQMGELWHRDGASSMKCPSIDRIDNDGDYTARNCRFIERVENSRRVDRDALHLKQSKPINQLSLTGAFIKRWDSVSSAGRHLNGRGLWKALNNAQRTAYGFKWEYATK